MYRKVSFKTEFRPSSLKVSKADPVCVGGGGGGLILRCFWEESQIYIIFIIYSPPPHHIWIYLIEIEIEFNKPMCNQNVS